MDHSAELLWIFGWRWLFYCNCLWLEGQRAVQGWGCQGRGCVLDLVATEQPHTTHGSTPSKARGGSLEQGWLHPSWARTAVVHWMTHSSWDRPNRTPSCRQLEEHFLFPFLFLIFDFFFKFLKKKKSSNFLGQCSLYLQQNLFILQEILSAAFFGNMQFSWWETTHKRSALSKEAFQNVSSLN